MRRLLLLLSIETAALAQGTVLTLQQAVDAALQNYPSIRVSQERMNAAAAGIRLAQTAYLPRVDGMAQLNRATRNTYYGLLLPQGVIPGVDGIRGDSFGTVWDSGIGVLGKLAAVRFRITASECSGSSNGAGSAEATMNRTRYDVAVATADAFLTVLAAQQTVEAARGAVESWQVLLRSTHALVESELRPGADESRVAAELAMAQAQVAKAEEATAVALANVAEFVGSGLSLSLQPGKMLEGLPAAEAVPLDANKHPLTLEQNAATAEEKARLAALARVDYPQFALQGLAGTRGTGLEADGARLGGLNGVVPTVTNLGLGLTVTFPFTDRYSIREQAAAQSANLRAAQAESQVITTKLQAEYNAAAATLDGARRVAAITPTEVTSARAALNQATARYQSELAPIDDVAQAQRLLVNAQIDDSLARLSVWRAKLQLDTARGDIQPFLTEASR